MITARRRSALTWLNSAIVEECGPREKEGRPLSVNGRPSFAYAQSFIPPIAS
jgi:hypothetical protein